MDPALASSTGSRSSQPGPFGPLARFSRNLWASTSSTDPLTMRKSSYVRALSSGYFRFRRRVRWLVEVRGTPAISASSHATTFDGFMQWSASGFDLAALN